MARGSYTVDGIHLRVANPGGTYVDLTKPEDRHDGLGFTPGGHIELEAVTVLRIAALLITQGWIDLETIREALATTPEPP